MTAHRPAPPATGWMPASPCGPHCLPPAGPPTAAERLRVARRLAGLVVVLVAALVVVPLLGRPGLGILCRAVLAVTGVRLRVHGRPADEGALVVANHVSWIDVVALGAVTPVRMLAKREVRQWPLVGALAARTGALFLDRGALHALPGTVAATAGALRVRASVGVFAEGTTWCGAAAGPLRHAPFQAALDAGAPVQPVAIVLRGPDGRPAPEAAFIGEQTLVDALGRGLRLRRITCEITLLPVLAPGGTRRELAALAAAAISAVTGAPHPVPASRRTEHSAPVPVAA